MAFQHRLAAIIGAAILFFFCVALFSAHLLPASLLGTDDPGKGDSSLQHGTSKDASRFEDEPLLYAVADLHGDLEQALAALQLVGLADAGGNWTGGKAIVVQTGDLLDRGPNSLALVQLFERLKDGARAAGGAVHTLLGNHELLNLNSQFAYVSREELAALGAGAGPDTGKRSSAQLLNDGMHLWRQHMALEAPVGRALRQRLGATIQGSGPCRTLFVHAALLPGMLAEVELRRPGETLGPDGLLEALNDDIREILACNGKACKSQQSFLNDEGSLVWSRAFVRPPLARVCALATQVLERLGAQRMVVGHNVMQNGRVKSICAGRVHLTDVGISASYGGNMAVYECRRGVASAIYKGKREEQLN